MACNASSERNDATKAPHATCCGTCEGATCSSRTRSHRRILAHTAQVMALLSRTGLGDYKRFVGSLRLTGSTPSPPWAHPLDHPRGPIPITSWAHPLGQKGPSSPPGFIFLAHAERTAHVQARRHARTQARAHTGTRAHRYDGHIMLGVSDPLEADSLSYLKRQNVTMFGVRTGQVTLPSNPIPFA